MKKVLKTILTLAAAAAVSATVQAVFAETYFSEDFESAERMYNQTAAGTPFDGYLEFTTSGAISAKTVENPDGDGRAMEITTQAGGVINAGITSGLLASGAAVNTGRVTMSYDLYIPKLLDNDDIINIGANTNQQTLWIKNTAAENNLNSYFTKYPVGEWFTVQFTFDYDSDRGQVNVITPDDAYTLDVMTAKTTFADGINSFRLHGESKTAGMTFYVDNIKYYDDAIAEYYTDEKVWYNFDFNATGSNPISTGALKPAQGGGAAASLSYLSDISKTALQLKQPAGGTLHLDTVQLFNDLTASEYVLDIGMYIPKESLQGNDKIIFYPRHAGLANKFVINLKGPDSSVADNTNLVSCYATPIFDEEFTLRLVWSYVPFTSSAGVRRAEAYIVDNNGAKRFIGKADINTNDDYKLRALRMSLQGNTSANDIYITKIRQYNASNIPSEITFDSGEYTVGQSLANNYVDADLTIGVAKNVGTVSIGKDPGNDSNIVLNYDLTADAAEKSNGIRVDTMNHSLNSDSDYVILTADMYMPTPLESSETITYSPYTTKDGTSSYSGRAAVTGLTLKGANAGIGGDYSAGVSYPVGEWFTMRMIVDIKSGAVNYSIVCKDGSVQNIGSISDGQAANIRDNGILWQRIIYKRAQNKTLTAAKTISIDNLKITSITFGDTQTELIQNPIFGDYYMGTVNYEARGDVNMEGTMFLASYDKATGGYVDCVDFNIDNKTLKDGKHSIEGNIDVDIDEDSGVDPEEQFDIKVMLWNSFAGMKPLIPIAK